jgi:two-component system sensor histidine kinase HydH
VWPIRAQDILLAVMFGVLIWLAHDGTERFFLVFLAILQLIEGKVGLLERPTWRMGSVLLQLACGYLLIGYTTGITSPYYLVLLLLIVSTATYLGVVGTIVSSLLAIAIYLSFLFYVDWSRFSVEDETFHVLTIRCLLPAVAALLVNTLAEAIRTQSAKYKAAAEDLAAANQSLRAAEAAMRRTERLAALGQLSAGLAHELRNPLGSIKGSAELLERATADSNPMAKELAGIISEEVDRTNSLVTRFLDFARPLEPRRDTASLIDIIDRAARRAKVEIERDYPSYIPDMGLDVQLMEQVFLNLIQNAAQASLPDAPVTVRIRERDEEMHISVIDQGCGIPAEKIETIFNPFVTTKQNGVGLGLAIVAKIVDGHSGRMSVESEPGRGSTFHVILPLSVNQPKPVAAIS